MRQPEGICRERTRIGCVSFGWNSGGISAKRTRLDGFESADEVMVKIDPDNGPRQARTSKVIRKHRKAKPATANRCGILIVGVARNRALHNVLIARTRGERHEFCYRGLVRRARGSTGARHVARPGAGLSPVQPR